MRAAEPSVGLFEIAAGELWPAGDEEVNVDGTSRSGFLGSASALIEATATTTMAVAAADPRMKKPWVKLFDTAALPALATADPSAIQVIMVETFAYLHGRRDGSAPSLDDP
jgi:hypothetical protein